VNINFRQMKEIVFHEITDLIDICDYVSQIYSCFLFYNIFSHVLFSIDIIKKNYKKKNRKIYEIRK